MDRRSVPLDQSPDSVFRQVLAQRIALTCLDLVVLIDVIMIGAVIWPGRQRNIVEACQRRVVHAGDVAPSFDLFVICRQLVVEDGRLHVVEPRIGSPRDDGAVLVPAMVAQKRYFSGDIVVVGNDRTSIAEAAEDLGRVEAEGAE